MGRRKKEQASLETNNNLTDTSKQPLSEKAENIENLIDEYKITQEEKKPRKPRTPKAEKKEVEDFAIIANIQASIALDIIISRMPVKTPLNDAERNSFDKAFTELVKKYYESMSRFGVEFQFGLALILILIPRINFKKIIDERKNKDNIRENRNRQDMSDKDIDSGKSSE